MALKLNRTGGGRVAALWREHRLECILAALALAGGVTMLVAWLSGEEPQQIRYEAVGICDRCGHRVEIDPGRLPMDCPNCDGTLWPAHECDKCGYVFAYTLQAAAPPPAPEGKQWDALPKARQSEILRQQEQYYQATLRAGTCPKCGSPRTHLYHTDEQKKRMSEWGK